MVVGRGDVGELGGDVVERALPQVQARQVPETQRGVVEQDLYSLGGEGLVLVYPVREKKVTSIKSAKSAAAKKRKAS